MTTPPIAQPTLGISVPGEGSVPIDVGWLIRGRLLVQANSGGGKSWALRRILEQTYGHCQQIVVDPEGEFHTLRARRDYILAAARGGDCTVRVDTAARLARRLIEHGASAILDLSELGGRSGDFVAAFIGSLVEAPRELWRRLLVVVDEAQLFCPEQGQRDDPSAAAIVELMTRGRKRGLAGILATQRLSMVRKTAAAQCSNKLIGRTALDTDVRRAAFDLGFTSQEARKRLRDLAPGNFYATGPAFCAQVIEVRVGDVLTPHPDPDDRPANPTPPSPRVREMIAELDLSPIEDEAGETGAPDDADAARLRGRIAELEDLLRRRDEVTVVERIAPLPPEALAAVSCVVDGARRLSSASEDLLRVAGDLAVRLTTIGRSTSAPIPPGSGSVTLVDSSAGSSAADRLPLPTTTVVIAPGDTYEIPATTPEKRPGRDPAPKRRSTPAPGNPRTPARQKILEAVSWMERIGVREPGIETVAFLAGYSPRGGAFTATRARLCEEGHLRYPRPGHVALTEQGRSAVVDRATIGPGGPELRAAVLRRLPDAERRILRVVLEQYPRAVSVDQIGRATNYKASGGAFTAARGRLRAMGVVRYPAPGLVQATDVLFPERQSTEGGTTR